MPSPSDCATLQAIFDGIQAVRADAETEWGSGRLPLLVDDEMRAKFYRQCERWSRAYQSAWEADTLTRDQLSAVESAAGGMKRAWAALSAAATEAGHRPIFPDVWEARLPDGSVIAFVRTEAEVGKVRAQNRSMIVYTMDEIAYLVGTLIPESLQLAKATFEGARFQSSDRIGRADKSWVKEGDPIPF